jgi:hypothetical protein
MRPRSTSWAIASTATIITTAATAATVVATITPAIVATIATAAAWCAAVLARAWARVNEARDKALPCRSLPLSLTDQVERLRAHFRGVRRIVVVGLGLDLDNLDFDVVVRLDVVCRFPGWKPHRNLDVKSQRLGQTHVHLDLLAKAGAGGTDSAVLSGKCEVRRTFAHLRRHHGRRPPGAGFSFPFIPAYRVRASLHRTYAQEQRVAGANHGCPLSAVWLPPLECASPSWSAPQDHWPRS